MPQGTTSDNGKFSFVKPLTILDFAKKVGLDAGLIIKHFFIAGRITNLNTVLVREDCVDLCANFEIEFSESSESEIQEDLFGEYLYFLDTENLVEKTPVVTIMGHVDHGKTTLLDKIRGTNVTEREFGGITQHIGAYQVVKSGKKITFLDTPGHQAFTKMRSRGANVTDIVVIVVAADDGVKPQTIEAIQHALSAKVRIIVFINKIDKGNKNVPALKNSLTEHNLLLEEFGGEVICLEGSALKGQGIDELLETILLLAEMSEFKTTKDSPAVGTVVESNVDKGMGPTANILLRRGVLKCGDFLAMRSSTCKVKTIVDEYGKSIKILEPSVPAKISGFKTLPEAGDRFISFQSESKTKEFMEKFEKLQAQRESVLQEKSKDVENLNLIIRADVSGSLEAMKEIVYSYKIPITAANIGSFSESDLQLALISNSILINFNQKISQAMVNRIKEMKLILKNYRSVYEFEEELQEFIEKNKIIEYDEEILGKAHVLKLWHHSKVGTIAGCKVIEGKIMKTDKVRVVREGEILYTSTIKSFKTEAYEIKECSENQECGIVVNNWNDIKENDIIEAFREVPKTL